MALPEGASRYRLGRKAPFFRTMRLAAIPSCIYALLLLQGLAQAHAAECPPGQQIEGQQRSAPVPQRVPQQKTSTVSALQGMVTDDAGLPLAGVVVTLESSMSTTIAGPATTSGDGIFRLLQIPPGAYDLILIRQGGIASRRQKVELRAGEVLSIEVHLPAVPATAASPLAQMPAETIENSAYRELSRRPDADGAIVVPPEAPPPPESAYFQSQWDRWGIPMPNYHRYGANSESPYVLGHWYDPFNRNVLKADKPIFGKTFFSFTGQSITAVDG